jgi:Ca2+-binding RTX toxin-like protein
MATFNGGTGNDSLAGGTGNDLINGLAGNDTLGGNTGDDTMDGGVGNDTFIVNSSGDKVIEAFNGGTDTIQTALLDPLATFSLASYTYVENLAYTGTLAAQLKGNSLANLIKANSAAATNDTLYGGAGNDTLFGYGGNDSLMGGSGDDRLDGGIGTDMMIGGIGNDTYVVSATTDRVFEYASGGFDTIESAALKDLRLAWTQQVEGLTYTGTTAAALHGNGLGNSIVSQSATNDTLRGYDGNDTLDGGGGTDSMLGGVGDDVYMVSTADVVNEVAGEGTDTFIGAKTSIGIAAYATTIENLFYTGSTGAAVTGNAMDNVVSGGSGADTVSGANGNDTLGGGSGADSLIGGNGNDALYGGGFQNSIVGAMVADTAVDTLDGGAGNDTYWVDNLSDRITEATTGGTRDVVFSSIDNSLATPGNVYANVEALVLRAGSDAWYGGGGTGNDIIVGNQGDNHLVGGAGNDTLSASADTTFYYYTGASDVLEGGAGNDALVGFSFYGGAYPYLQEVTYFGGAGNDLYVIGTNSAGAAGLDSGGTDTAVLMGSGSIAAIEGVENLVLYGAGGANDTAALAAINAVYGAAYNGASYTGSLGTAIEGTGNELANQITGNAFANRLYGLAGNDAITGGDGNDTLDGGAGTDNLTGGAGNDWFVVDGADVVVEAVGGGFDIVSSATLTSYAGFANVEGLQYTGTNNVGLNNGSGNTSNDYFGGGSGADTLAGFGGNDTLDGGAGNDEVNGGAGADSLLGGIGDDSVVGGTENDTIGGGVGNDSLEGNGGNDSIDGGDGNDTIAGGTENDSILGGLGVDSILGGEGNDQLWAGENSYGPGDTSANTVLGGDGNDTITGARGADTLSGNAGNDLLVGGEGSDLIDGGSVTNSGLYYSPGGDVLWGGVQYGAANAVADTFRIGAPTADNKAVDAGGGSYVFNTGTLIADFSSGSDTIRLAASMVGDNDTTLENVFVKDAAGGTFTSTAEMVIFRTNVIGPSFSSGSASIAAFNALPVTTVIGSADAAFAAGAERIFVVDNGISSAIFQFTAANADAAVTVDELALLAVVYNDAAMDGSDFGLF